MTSAVMSGPYVYSGYNDPYHIELIRGYNEKTCKRLVQGLAYIRCFKMLVAPLPSIG